MSLVGQFYSLRGAARLARFRLRHHRPSLDRAIVYLERSAARLATDHPDRALVLGALGNGLLWRYELTSDRADLDSAVDRLRDAIASPGASAGDRVALGGDLAAVLRSCFVQSGKVSDLDEAIDAAGNAIQHGEEATSATTNRALALLARYEHTARFADLLAALRDARTPVRGRVDVALHRGLRLGALIEALGHRYRYTSDPEDLTEAIAAGREVLATLSPVDPNRAQYEIQLSSALRLSGDPALLSEAVEVAEKAVEAIPDHVDRANRLSELSMACFMRHLATGDRNDLRRAREVADQALAGSTGANRPMLQQRVALLARRWFDVTGDSAALDHGEGALRDALAATPDRPLHDALVCELADLQSRRRDTVGLATTRRLLADAVQQTGDALSLRTSLRTATRLAELAVESGDIEQALLGYRRAVELLPTAARPGLRRPVREARLKEAPPATDAAAHAIRADNSRLAVELLDAGRSVLWSQQLNLRTELADLRAIAPDLADRLDEIRAWIEASDRVPHNAL